MSRRGSEQKSGAQQVTWTRSTRQLVLKLTLFLLETTGPPALHPGNQISSPVR